MRQSPDPAGKNVLDHGTPEIVTRPTRTLFTEIPRLHLTNTEYDDHAPEVDEPEVVLRSSLPTNDEASKVLEPAEQLLQIPFTQRGMSSESES